MLNAICFVVLFLLLPSDVVLAGQFGPSLEVVTKTKVGSILSIQKRRNSFAVDYALQGKGGSFNKKRAVIKVPEEIVQSQFFDAAAISIFDDLVPAIEVTGSCGNKVCEKLIYRFNEAKMGYRLFFRGAYSSVSVLNGYLIEAGSSGCCAFEYHAYKIPEDRFPISGAPQIIVGVSNISEGASADAVDCAFTDAEGRKVVPPHPDWLELCRVYGESYRLKK
jgi:hypothetical protein